VEIAERGRPFDFACAIARRREAYHVRVEEASRRAARGGAGAGTGGSRESASAHARRERRRRSHGAISVKEPGLERLLEYDERPRYASQEWIRSSAAVEARADSRRDRTRAGRAPFATAPVMDLGAARAEPPCIVMRSQNPSHAAMRKEVSPGPDEREFEVGVFRRPARGWLISGGT